MLFYSSFSELLSYLMHLSFSFLGVLCMLSIFTFSSLSLLSFPKILLSGNYDDNLRFNSLKPLYL